MHYIIDTNILIEDPHVFTSLKCSSITIPIAVIEELDNLKKNHYNARKAIKFLDSLSKTGDIDLGVATEYGSIVRICNDTLELQGLDMGLTDNKIIASAYYVAEEQGDAILLSNDFNVRLKARSFGIHSEEWNVVDPALYLGYKVVGTTTEMIGKLYSEGSVFINEDDLYHNQYIQLIDYCGGNALAQVSCPYKGKLRLVNSKTAWGIRPKNREQIFAMDALLNKNIPLVTVTGKSGSGKTYLSLAVALEYVLNSGDYSKIMLVKPAVQADKEEKEVGILPGEKNEKLLPWLANFTDNLEQLLGSRENFEMYMDNRNSSGRKKIELESITQMRGRNLNDTILIVDEAQNLTMNSAKMITTRMGSNSKLVLLGDLSQIDHRFLDEQDNGLYYTICKSKKTPLSAQVHLSDSTQRSALADWAANNL